jgi:folate-dependent tRNA-U54 methylase TrmFO/GidA
MIAQGVNTSVNAQQLAKAGISVGDLHWLKACRNSPVSQTASYRNLANKVSNFVRDSEMKALGAALA